MRAALAAAAAHEVMHEMTGEVQALRDARTQLADYHAAQRNLREARKGVQAAQENLAAAQAGKKEAAQALADARQNLAASREALREAQQALAAARAVAAEKSQAAQSAQQAVADYAPEVEALRSDAAAMQRDREAAVAAACEAVGYEQRRLEEALAAMPDRMEEVESSYRGWLDASAASFDASEAALSDAASAAADRAQGRAAGYVSMTVPRRELDVLPQEPLTGENSRSVAQLAAVRNFVILLNPGRFESRAAYLAALRASPADLLIIDLYYGAEPLTRREVARLQEKPQGGRRLVLAYLSVGEAADYRPYWQKHWAAKRPDWLAQPNPAWPDSYRVKYWSRPWRRILYGSADAYLDEIIDAGFDGAFLDVMDAWQTFQ